jgi:creatinine amidohydrolase
VVGVKQTAEKHELFRMTWKEIEAAFAKDPVVLIPMGSTEQQGPHTPTGDYRCAEAVASAVAAKTGTYCTTTIPFGYSDYFRGFPGTISLSFETMLAVLSDTCECLMECGVRRLMFLSGHAGNGPVLDRLARRIRREKGIMIPTVDLWLLLTPEFRKKVFDGKNPSGHGSEPLTSLSTYLYEEDMRPDLLGDWKTAEEIHGFKPKMLAKAEYEGQELSMYWNVADLSPFGITGGDPAAGTVERGRILFEEVVKNCAVLVEKWKSVDPALPTIWK